MLEERSPEEYPGMYNRSLRSVDRFSRFAAAGVTSPHKGFTSESSSPEFSTPQRGLEDSSGYALGVRFVTDRPNRVSVPLKRKETVLREAFTVEMQEKRGRVQEEPGSKRREEPERRRGAP